MKLLTKTSLHYLWVIGVLLLVTCVFLFQLLKRDISAEIKEQLELQAELVAFEIKEGKPVEFPLVKVERGITANAATVFKDTIIYDYLQHQPEDYYLLSQVKLINKKQYRITVLTAYIGWSEYFKSIIYMFILLITLLCCAGVIVNYVISKKIWHPFFLNMGVLKKFSLADEKEPALIASNIDEFKELNAVMLDFVKHARKEYQGVQEFSENASHELQTPISVIRTRLESLSQLPMDTTSANYLNDAKQALNRLSKVNKGLLLLAKITHDNFPDQQQISLSVILTEMIEQFDELFLTRGIQLKNNIQAVDKTASPHLVNILFSNILSNMQKYSTANSAAWISIDEKTAVFKNPGEPLPFPEEVIFTRFKKAQTPAGGIGLGLSIIKQICQVHKWAITYVYADGMHVFTITFS